MKKFLLALCLLMGHAALYAATDILSTPSAHGSDFVTVTFNANGGTGGVMTAIKWNMQMVMDGLRLMRLAMFWGKSIFGMIVPIHMQTLMLRRP